MPKIGLEVHVHLTSLNTKLFCNCPSDYSGKDPNTIVCPVCLGLPGAIPVPNEKALEKALMVAIALNCSTANKLVFTRKHYFYPDMAKNYQISQYDGLGSLAIAKEGKVRVGKKEIRIRRINIEEDPAKTIYPTGSMLSSRYTLLDYNRSGMTLLEIVTEPDMETSEEARQFMEKLRNILEHLEVCNCDIEGSMRADANVSVEGGERVEVKNIGSIKDIKDAIDYEIARQKAAISQGLATYRETRHWDGERRVTVPTRSKESDEDYRYFPDPDLPPFNIDEKILEKIKSEMPELPDARANRFMKQYGINEYEASILVSDKQLADFFESCCKIYTSYKKLANLLINDFLRRLNENNMRVIQSKATPQNIVKLMQLMDNGIITIKILKEILPDVVLKGIDPDTLVKERGLTAISDQEYLEQVIDEVINEEKDAVSKVREDPRIINYLVGKVMRKTNKRADPQLTNKILKEKLLK
jgi:aspartyl-tRNA(Asn)/glutamyl-tRNA(Gln) amidotransferase subunit B